jgi:acyl-CoA thioester hydrolase
MAPIKFYIHPVKVQTSDIDELKHVNNEVYLRWLIEAATAHSSSLGLSLSKYLELGQAFVVRRHELDYRLPAYLGDKIHVKTWTEKFEGSRGLRHYEIIRERDSRVILAGLTVWVFIDMKTGRPTAIPKEILNLYFPGESES